MKLSDETQLRIGQITKVHTEYGGTRAAERFRVSNFVQLESDVTEHAYVGLDTRASRRRNVRGGHVPVLYWKKSDEET